MGKPRKRPLDPQAAVSEKALTSKAANDTKPDTTPEKEEDSSDKNKAILSKIDNPEIREIFSRLTPQQVRAAELDSGGMVNRNIIANKVGVNPGTISAWRQNDDYKQAVQIGVKILDSYGKQFRANFARLIISPALAELVNRMSDPIMVKTMATKDLVEIITRMQKELRLDTIIANDDSSGADSELGELQRMRNDEIIAQKESLKQLMSDGKIIEMPTQSTSIR